MRIFSSASCRSAIGAFLLLLSLTDVYSVGTGGDLDDPCPECPDGRKMAVWTVDAYKASIIIIDTPVWIDVPAGPSLEFTVTYKEMADYSFEDTTLLSPKWTTNFSAHVYVVPAHASHKKIVYLPDGRRETFQGSTSPYGYSILNHGKLEAIGGMSNGFKRISPDGSTMIFDHEDGSIYRLTRIEDPQGIGIDITYDGDSRMITIAHDLGPELTVNYRSATTGTTDFYQIASVVATGISGTRTATFSYDEGGMEMDDRLIAITDPEGIRSSFAYTGSTDVICTMTTPYGDTQFEYASEPGNGADKRVEITDPELFKTRVEYFGTDEPDEEGQGAFPLVSPNWEMQPILEFTDDL